jgi:hypothetical protein
MLGPYSMDRDKSGDPTLHADRSIQRDTLQILGLLQNVCELEFPRHSAALFTQHSAKSVQFPCRASHKYIRLLTGINEGGTSRSVRLS